MKYKIEAKTKEKGYSIIPLRLFINENGLAKLEIGLGKGKKHFDKRDTIKARDVDRDVKRKYGLYSYKNVPLRCVRRDNRLMVSHRQTW